MSLDTPLVSVVIPVFNGAPFVAKAVESVHAQSVKDVEILVVDDGSTDGTQAVLDQLQRTHGVTWFQQDHGGPARSRNRGIDAARGTWVALLDCDDVWLPDKLEAQLDLARAQPHVGVVHSDFEVVDEQGLVLEHVRGHVNAEPLVTAFVGGHTALPSTLLIRRDILKKIGALNPALYGSEDADLSIRLYDVTGFACVDRPLVKKLQRGHGYRDMAFDESTHRDKVFSSRERFLQGLENRSNLTGDQRRALDYEWANCLLMRGWAAERFGRPAEARGYYARAIRKAPFRLRGYTRWLRTFLKVRR
ncbi:MAG: glycosyltransferase [Nitrospira sp.]|nr:MAG: glycosyltransferase [Nitrospira sp.]